MRILSYSPFGYEGALVAVEVDLRRGIPAVDVVGLADGAVKESRERMRSAIRNSGFEFPMERVLISLSPADLKKEGAGFDLALALAVLDAGKNGEGGSAPVSDSAPGNGGANGPSNGRSSLDCDGAVLVMGELELSGAIRPVRGVHGAASTASAAGIKYCIVAAANASEAREVKGMRVFAAANLEEAFDALYRPELFTGSSNSETAFLPEGAVTVDGVLFPPSDPGTDFQDVKGQSRLIRALQIAAAGGHNLLAFGPPGCGKTLCLQRFGQLLPLLTVEEAQSVTRIHSLAGLLSPHQPLMRIPPFRIPHQTASVEGMCGGGVNCRPGEVSLAHNGVLFLDEAAEFKSSVLQMLRVPLENGRITLSRAGRSTVFPARFQLLLATNPCPCGNFGSEGKLCLCSAKSVEQYWRKFSGPLLDRVDIRIPVMGESGSNESSGGDAPQLAADGKGSGVGPSIETASANPGEGPYTETDDPAPGEGPSIGAGEVPPCVDPTIGTASAPPGEGPYTETDVAAPGEDPSTGAGEVPPGEGPSLGADNVPSLGADIVPVPTVALRYPIARAVKIQRQRQGKKNACLSPQEILTFCELGKEEKAFLDSATENNDFSQRAVASCLKLARTIADMEGSPKITLVHLREAISLRQNVGALSILTGV